MVAHSLLLTLLLGGGASLAQGILADPVRIGIILADSATTAGQSPTLAGHVAAAADEGARMAADEFGHNAELVGIDFSVHVETAVDAEEARQAAGRLVAEEEVFAIAGGFDLEQALALSEFAAENEILFLNIGAPHHELRNELCSRNTFHVEASAGMYLDALVGWFVRSGFRRWTLVHHDDDEGDALYRRTRWAMSERHFGAREAGRIRVAEEPDWEAAIEQVRRSRPEVVLLLLPAEEQLEFLQAYEGSGLEAEVTGFPYTEAQTRAFFEASRAAAPEAGSGFRATSWEATLDAYGARELIARFEGRFGMPMPSAAWAAYQAVKILFEAAQTRGSTEATELIEHLESEMAVFDIWKGIGVTFRPWDHQLRQSLFLVKIDQEADNPRDLANLVGELPALYLPRTEPVERLDQLGDLERSSRCQF